MSLDVLFTEAAEAGGPPHFTEDDIAQRVGLRHRRRRRVATGAAVLIVLGGIGLGVHLAGQSDEPSPVVAPVEITAVPLREEALVGEWLAVVPPDWVVDEAPTVTFAADGTYDHRGCNAFGGRWNLVQGRLGIGEGGPLHDMACDSSVAYDTTFAAGIATFYADGLLRFSHGATTVDYVRQDDPMPADPADPRATATTTIAPTEGALLGEWVETTNEPMARDVPFLEFTAGGRYTFSGCNDGAGDWAIEANRLTLDPPFESTLRTCRAVAGQPLLDVLLPGPADLTTDDHLVLRSAQGAIFLRRTGDGAVPTGGVLTDRRWVLDVGQDPASGLAPWIEFADDGTFTMTVSCGLGHGTWTTDGEEVAVTVTDPGPGNIANCAAFEVGLDTLGPITRILVGEELVIEHEPVPSPGSGQTVTPEQVLRPLDDIPVPAEADLLGEWSSGLVGSIGSTRTLFTFHDDGTFTPGDCPSLPWHVTDGVLVFEGSDDPCLVDYGFESPVAPLDVRLDGDVLYLSSPDVVTLLVRGDQHMNDTSISVNGPGPALQDAYAEMGVEPCCQVNGDGLTRRGFVWEGHEVGVEARVLADTLGDLGLDEVTVELDGQVVRGQGYRGTELAFDCGGYRFGMYTEADPIPDDVLLDAATALLAALPCRATAPT